MEGPIACRSSRRNFLNFAMAASAVATCSTIFSEQLLAKEHIPPYPKDAVVINANENPLGPVESARAAAIAETAMGGRYSPWLTDDLVQTFAQMEGLQPDYIQAFPGSSEPLHYSVLAFTSPTKSYVTADPGYEAGMRACKVSGARIVKVPLAKNYSHDVKAMASASADAGLIYVCTPNNPTGTLTSHSDIEYLVEHKPTGAIVLVDEAYIHFSDGLSVLDLVKADKDIVVLRTFSKIYGMAGLRCGFAIARPDLLQKLSAFGGWSAMPITALAAATASLKDPRVVPERKRINATVRASVFEWLSSNGYEFIPSQSNCFMLNTRRNGQEVIAAMRRQNVYIGRIWPIMPTFVRVTIGTRSEMDLFQTAFHRVMSNTVVGSLSGSRKVLYEHYDGVRIASLEYGPLKVQH